MATYDVTFSGAALPNGWAGTLEEFHQAVLASLTATVSSDGILFGQYKGTTPGSDIGPWLDSGIWKYHNGASYIPVKTWVWDAANSKKVQLDTQALTGDRTQTFQDADGIVALTDDVFTPRATQTPSGAGPYTVDFSLSNSFKLTIAVDFTLLFTNMLPGQHTWLAVVNSGAGAINATFPGEVHFGSVGPTAIAAGKTDLFIMRNVGGTIYMEQLTGYV